MWWLLAQWGSQQLTGAAPRLKKPKKGAGYYPKNTQYLLGFNEPNIPCARGTTPCWPLQQRDLITLA